IDEANGPSARQVQCVCHNTPPWLISVSLGRWSRTMEFVRVLRLLLPILGIGIFVLVARLIKPTRHIVLLALKLCWITGSLNLLWGIIGTRCRILHFTLNHLVFGLPLDLYVTVRLVYGGALLSVYSCLKTNHSACVLTSLPVPPTYPTLLA